MNFRKTTKAINDAGIGLILVLMCLLFTIVVPRFATLSNLRNIFTQISINTTLAVGMTYVILVGGIDLSVGSVMALATVGAGMILTAPAPSEPWRIILAVLASLAAGSVLGFFNGFVSEKWKLPAFIVTLGTMGIARGSALFITDARTIFGLPKAFLWFGQGTVLGDLVPVMFVIAISLVFLG